MTDTRRDAKASNTSHNPPTAGTEPADRTAHLHLHDRGGDGATQALNQEQEAVTQMGNNAQLGINEGGRTNDSHATHNPEGAVHGLPKPALKGTWR